MVSARVRGIYSTALTKLLLDNNFQISDPSDAIRRRFNLEPRKEMEADINIWDRLDRQGVNVTGASASIKEFVQILKSTLIDAVYRWEIPPIGGYPTDMPETFEPELSIHDKGSGLSGFAHLSVEFPSSSKRRMDSLRAEVTPTLDGHHFYKACGGRIAQLLETAEKMLEKNCPRDEVESLFAETVRKEFPNKGSLIRIEHVKIDGKIFDLGPARIIEINDKNGKITLQRSFSKTGIYDGLGVQKEPGDIGLTEIKMGDWSFVTKYFSSEQREKGAYININTPVEVYPGRIRYVDLEVDICVWPNGEFKVLDVDKFEEYIHAGYLCQRIKNTVEKEIEKVVTLIGQVFPN
ncbi:MAG: DUF402 domain-containing protein [Nitrososphaerota archaeon]|nr:DUF402 domain-containing protein [Candidatus Bathyarchaeota archaeon]MDW8048995.1 DUF402 domain-containing protein [Nitrososphaerota archaeon]